MEDRTLWARRLGLASVAVTLLLMTLGAWVKATGSGAACPDWPLCYGKALPPFPSGENGGTWNGRPIGYTQAQELYEWTHRLVGAIAFLPVLAFAVVTALGKRFTPQLRILPAAGVGLYLFQGVLGALTVVLRPANPPWATTWHLLNALLLLVTLTVATSYAYLRPELPRRRFGPRPSGAPAGFTYPGAAADPFPGEESHGG